MNRKLIIIVLAVISAAALSAYRPYGRQTRAKAAWMTVSSIKTGQEYYLEVSQDGKSIMRVETPKTLTSRRGTIKESLVKDFYREIENSEIINSQNLMKSKMVFYRGDLMKISAYISGEISRTEAPLNKFGEAFSYAFGEVKKAVSALPQETKLTAFLRAEPVTDDALTAFRAKVTANGENPIIETVELLKVKPLMAAIKEPYRLIPIEDAEALKELQAFVSKNHLYGLRTLFYVPSTRGTFKCQVLDAFRKDIVTPGKKTKPAPVKKAVKKI